MFIQDMGIGKLLVTIGAAALLMLLEVFLGLRSIPIALNFPDYSKFFLSR